MDVSRRCPAASRYPFRTKSRAYWTLDPLATGVLLLCIGKATRIAQYLSSLEKEYLATIRLGVSTDTLDADGIVLDQRDVQVSVKDIVEILPAFLGDIEQIPPMFSAVKSAGRRLYTFARDGQSVERSPRIVHISDIHIVHLKNDDLTIRVRCSKGTYIRSLASDIGERLECGAHVASLHRTRVGQFRADESLSLDTIENEMKEGTLYNSVVSMNDALMHLSKVNIGREMRWRIEKGMPVEFEEVGMARKGNDMQGPVRILGEDGVLLGLGQIERTQASSKSALHPIRVFV